MSDLWQQYGVWVLAVFFILAGVNHFLNPQFYRPMMPPYIPRHALMILLSGIAELALGVFLTWDITRAWAAWGIVLLLIAVFPVHLYMYQARDTVFQRIPKVVIVLRIPLQFLLIYWAWTYTTAGV